MDGLSLRLFENRPGKFSNEPDRPLFKEIETLLTAPGTRLVMPSEQTEDFMSGLRYTGEFGPLRSGSSSDKGPTHETPITTYARVFVNDIAEPYMKREKLRFPVGSMIVRERLRKSSSETPEMISVMIKRERGFSPTINDWGFALIDRAGAKISTGNASQSCVTCHAAARTSDFVFKTYLP